MTKFQKIAEEKMARWSLDSFWMSTMVEFFCVDDESEITTEMADRWHDIFTTPFANNGNIFTGKECF